MNIYVVSLALSYFKEKREDYSINELMAILGYSNAQIDDLISNLLENHYINYIDNLLDITEDGLKFLIMNNQDDICLQAEDYIIPHIDPKSAISIDVPYVPERFMKKFKG